MLRWQKGLTARLLNHPERPTCILASDDYAALGVMKTIQRMGMTIPYNISIAGYDGISISQVLDPKLTTIKQDTVEIGKEAAKKLINLIESPMTTPLEHLVLGSQLICGESVCSVL